MTDKCIICLKELHSNIGCITPCGHCFHRGCFEALRNNMNIQNSTPPNTHNDSETNNYIEHNNMILRCPMCNQMSKSFVDIFLTFDHENEESSNTSTRNGGRRNGSRCSISTRRAYSNSSVESIKSENKRLRTSLQDLKTVSRGQSELILDLLPRFQKLERKLKSTIKEKEEYEKSFWQMKDENSVLDMIKNERDLLEERLNQSNERNEGLHSKLVLLERELIQSKKKRNLLETKEAMEFVNDMKNEMMRYKEENEKLQQRLETITTTSSRMTSENISQALMTTMIVVSTVAWFYFSL